MQRAEVRNLSKNLFSSHEAVKQVAMSKLETAIKEGAISEPSTFPLIHQGLFYQFWDSDKLQRQSEDAKRIAKLMENFKQVDMLGPWIDQQFRSLRRHWDKIDYLRIDKFLMLIRYLIRQFFGIFHSCNWKLDDKSRLLNFLISGLFGVPVQGQVTGSEKEEDGLNLMGEKIIHSSALGVPLQFFGIWDQQFLKVYKQKDSDNEEDKDQTMVDIKLLFGKTVEIYAHTEIPELRDRILQRIEVVIENPDLPITKTALVKIFFDSAKNPSTVEASRSKLYELMRRVQWSDNTDAKRNEELSLLMEERLQTHFQKTHSLSQESDSQKETSSNRSEKFEKSETKEMASPQSGSKGVEEVEDEDFELSEMIPRLLEKKNKKLCKRVRKFMDKRREMSAKMKKRAQQMALLGLPLSMWIAEKQRKELLKQANIEWEQLKSEIQHQLEKYQIDSVPPKRKKKKRVTIVQPEEQDDEVQAQLDTMLMEDEAPLKDSDNELDMAPEIPEVPSLEPVSPQAMTPVAPKKKDFASLSPAKGKGEDVLQIEKPSPPRKHKIKPKKRSLRSNDPNVLTRSQRKVRFSPQPLLRTFHQNEIVSLKKMLSSKFNKSPSNGIIKGKQKKT